MIDLAAVDSLLISAQPILAVTLYPAAAISVLVFGSEAHRLGSDTEHDLSDYFPARERLRPAGGDRRRLRGVGGYRSALSSRRRYWPLVDRQVSSPEAVVEQVARRYGVDSADRAARFLAEIAAEQRDVIWNAGVTR